MAETERENIRESTLEGLDAAARRSEHTGPPPVVTGGHTAHRAAAPGEPRVGRVDPARPDHHHRQAQGPGSQRRQHLPRARRAREERGVPRRRRGRRGRTPTSRASGTPTTSRTPAEPASGVPTAR
ncbi:hypothetical protein OG233_21680 [Streptomyces sp. NBC_01218]|uniref:hypothetical protein n=1 Tax=unclassified Streptomyces TaxID=2593676 RepID=UPI002E0E89AF|nr:hypothetical protein OG233_21680 [Streptomyces sp. NBC_01218]